MSWWALTYLDNNRTFHHLSVLSATNHPAHLIMAWARYKPTRQPIYRIIRGKRILCGYKYIWDTPNLVEQNEPLDTFTHSFGPISLASTDHVWYYLFSPEKLYDRYCQGPLVHVWPPEAHTWTSKAYVGTQLKGVYYTDSFTGPGGTHPVWNPHNQGLHSLRIWQLQPDPMGLAYRIYALAGAAGDRILYRRTPPISDSWISILTNPHAVTLTGSVSGELCYVTTSVWHPAHLWVLFNSAIADNGTWCLHSQDYGETWTAHQIFAGTVNYAAGNIAPGLQQGTSPYDPGSILYAALCSSPAGSRTLWLSLDLGESWTRKAVQGHDVFTPLCLPDPTDQSIVYFGASLTTGLPYELFRSQEHGANLLEVDGPLHLGLSVTPFPITMWINPADHDHAVAIQASHIFTTIDYCLNWTDRGPTSITVARLAILWENPDRLYLARNTSGALPPPASRSHTIFVSEDYGATMYGKSGAYSFQADGHGDSIPYNCGGVCLEGIQPFPPY